MNALLTDDELRVWTQVRPGPVSATNRMAAELLALRAAVRTVITAWHSDPVTGDQAAFCDALDVLPLTLPEYQHKAERP